MSLATLGRQLQQFVHATFTVHRADAAAAHELDRTGVRLFFCFVVPLLMVPISRYLRLPLPSTYRDFVIGMAVYGCACLGYRALLKSHPKQSTRMLYSFALLDPILVIGAAAYAPDIYIWMGIAFIMIAVRIGLRYGVQLLVLTWIAGAVSVGVFFKIANTFENAPHTFLATLASLIVGVPLCVPVLRLKAKEQALQLEYARLQTFETANRELEEKVANRTHELREAHKSVAEGNSECRRLIAQGNILIEEERHRIAMEIHDDMNAMFLVLRMRTEQLQLLAAKLPATPPVQNITKVAVDMMEHITQLYGSARKIVKELRPESIDTLGLTGAVRDMVESYEELHSACRFSLRVSNTFPLLRGTLAIASFRLVQEALNNVVKHSDASSCKVTLDTSDDRTKLVLKIDDDGKGFDSMAGKHAGIGLIGMRERVEAVGGEIHFRHSQPTGTSVLVLLPYDLHE